MSTWSTLGLPPPEAGDYSYSIDAGLRRTPFATANPRQSRRHETNKRLFNLSVQLSHAQLKTATDFLEENGFTWFSIDLLSGQVLDQIVSPHCVRVYEDFTISAIGNGYFQLQMVCEQLVERSVMVTTTLYPVEAVEGISTGAPAGFTGEVRSTSFRDDTSLVAPIPFTGTNVQTVFRRYLYVDSGEERIEHDSTSLLPPAGYTGIFVETTPAVTIQITVDSGPQHIDHESTNVSAPVGFTGTYIAAFLLDYDAGQESTDITAPAGFTGTLE